MNKYDNQLNEMNAWYSTNIFMAKMPCATPVLEILHLDSSSITQLEEELGALCTLILYGLYSTVKNKRTNLDVLAACFKRRQHYLLENYEGKKMPDYIRIHMCACQYYLYHIDNEKQKYL